MSIREKFVKDFGEEQTRNIEKAAICHSNGINNKNKGSDHFKWCLLICIGYQCMEKESFRNYHQISISWKVLKQWIKDNGDLRNHDGDCDYISLFAGVYNEFV